MANQPLRQLVNVLRGCIKGGNHTRALRLLATNLPLTGGHYFLRRHAAEVLRELGHEREAAEIFEVIVRHYTNDGQPLLALGAIGQLRHLEPDVASHFDHLARVYASGSPFLDRAQTISSPPGLEPGVRLDLSGAAPELPFEALVEMVYGLSVGKERFTSTPEAVPPMTLLSRFDGRTLRTLVELLEQRTLSDGETLCAPDAPLETPSWVISGTLRAVLPDGRESRVGAGALLGHRTLLGQPATDQEVTLSAQGEVELLIFSRETLAMIRNDVMVQSTVTGFDRAAMLDRALSSSSIFARVPPEERAELLDHMEARLLSAGTKLIHQGQRSDGLYLIVDGKVDINKRDGQWDVTFKTLAVGEVVGEISLVTDGPAVATVVTSGAARVLFIPVDEARTMCERYPGVLAELRESAAKRLLAQEEGG